MDDFESLRPFALVVTERLHDENFTSYYYDTHTAIQFCHSKTADERDPLLVHTLINYNNNNSDSVTCGSSSSSTAMASKNTAKTTAVETNVNPVHDFYGKDTGLEAGASGSGNVEPLSYDGGLEPESVALARAIHELEGKKTHWYSYLTTKEFWIVLALGYVILN